MEEDDQGFIGFKQKERESKCVSLPLIMRQLSLREEQAKELAIERLLDYVHPYLSRIKAIRERKSACRRMYYGGETPPKGQKKWTQWAQETLDEIGGGMLLIARSESDEESNADVQDQDSQFERGLLPGEESPADNPQGATPEDPHGTANEIKNPNTEETDTPPTPPDVYEEATL